MQVLLNVEKSFFKEGLEIIGASNSSRVHALFINMQWVDLSDKVIQIQ